MCVCVCLIDVHLVVAHRRRRRHRSLSALKEQNRHLAQVEVDKMARLVRHVRAKVTPDDAMPCGIVLLVELLLDVRGNILRTK